jgi:hypothetical protein
VGDAVKTDAFLVGVPGMLDGLREVAEHVMEPQQVRRRVPAAAALPSLLGGIPPQIL